MGKLAHPRLRLAMLLHGEVPACHVAAHLLQVLRVALGGGSRWRRLGLLGGRRLLLVRGSYLVRHLHSPGTPHGAAVHERLPVPLALHARVDAHLTAAPAATVRDLGDRGVVVLRVRRCQAVPGGIAHHPVGLLHEMHLLFVLIIVIKVGQLALILGGRRVVQGGLQGSKALVYRHLLTHGIHGIFGVPTFSQAFEAFAEKIPILAKKTHHPRIRHLLATPAPSKLQLGSWSVLHFTEVFVLKAYNPELIFFFMSFHISLMRLDPAVSGQVWIWVP